MDKKSRELVMAKLYFKNKDYKMAEKSFVEYLAMNPEDVAASRLLAQVYEQNKKFDKAFEMYERCYLAEPDRTGVLLDICRILLMSEVWLEHVDYRKWLNLAIKAFPSNPIVVNFKALLSTLPQEEQTTPRREIVHTQVDDPLTKILDKLSSVERRLENIETKLGNLSISDLTKTPAKQDTPISQEAPKLPSPIKSHISSKQEPTKPKVTEPTKPEVTEPTKPVVSELTKPLATATTNLFADSMRKLNIPTESPWSTQNNTGFSFKKADPVDTEGEKKTNSFSFFKTATESPWGKNSSPFSFATSLKSDTPSNFGFSNSALNNSWGATNNASTFSFSNVANNPSILEKPKDDVNEPEDGGENDEVVPNEELAIENTCDMQPIEIRSGEEDEDLLFESRCKLFRFRDKEYKERGLGSIKVLRHRKTGKGRLIMRREAIGLVCLNCWDCSKVERVRETQVRWVGLDASDGDPEPNVFLVKFRTQELTDTFMSHLTALFSESSSTNTSIAPASSVSQPPTADTSIPSLQASTFRGDNVKHSDKPDVELIDPKLDPSLVDKARKLQLPDLFYHKLKNQEPCEGCNGCEKDDRE